LSGVLDKDIQPIIAYTLLDQVPAQPLVKEGHLGPRAEIATLKSEREAILRRKTCDGTSFAKKTIDSLDARMTYHDHRFD
jgi:hypothetical protein